MQAGMIARVAEVLTCGRLTSSDTQPLTLAPPGNCQACGARLSRYRQAAETLCAPCAPNGGVQDESAGSGKAQAGSVPAAILEALRAGPMSRADITTVTRLSNVECESGALCPRRRPSDRTRRHVPRAPLPTQHLGPLLACGRVVACPPLPSSALHGRQAVGDEERERYDDDDHDRCDIPHHPACHTLVVPQ
jgi:hypothetical protein